MSKNRLHIRLCYLQEKQKIIKDIVLPLNTTIERAIMASGILSMYPEINLDKLPVGVYGRRRPLNTLLNDGDRIEIYRPVKKDGKKRILKTS